MTTLKDSYAYCRICGHQPERAKREEPNLGPLSFWDPDDGWIIGTLCPYCYQDYGRQTPQPDDYAYEEQPITAETDEDASDAIWPTSIYEDRYPQKGILQRIAEERKLKEATATYSPRKMLEDALAQQQLALEALRQELTEKRDRMSETDTAELVDKIEGYKSEIRFLQNEIFRLDYPPVPDYAGAYENAQFAAGSERIGEQYSY